jgi:hypothetical protein
MKALFKSLIILLLLPAVAVAGNNDKFKGKYTKEKKLSKEYTVNANAGLRIDNTYGNLDIVTWGQNRTVIEVTITTNGNNEEKVQKRLDDIDVEFSGNGSLVSAKTKIGSGGRSWSWWNNKNNGVSIEVNYVVKVPVTNSLDLSNDYGAINLNESNGNVKISCDYGQLNIGRLNADNNLLSFDYTNNSSIAYMKSGRINADYSSFSLDEVEYLELNADYTKTSIEKVGELNYNCDYGKLNVGDVGTVTGNGDYIPASFDRVSGNFNINSDYGSITVDRLMPAAGDVTIKSSYAGIRLGYDPGYNFDFMVNLSYASLSGKDDLNLRMESKDGSQKSYQGYHGSANSGNTINVRSSYGGVTLKKQ